MKRWHELTPGEQKRYGNGIGPDWFPPWLRDLITDFCSRFFLEASWRHHDFGYAKGGTEIDRINCDGRFLTAMRRDVARSDWRYKVPAWCACHGFYIAVRVFGSASFNWRN